VTGPYEALEADERTHLIDKKGLPYTVSGEHVVPAGPVNSANRSKQPKAAVPDALHPGGSTFALDRFVDHTWDEDEVL